MMEAYTSYKKSSVSWAPSIPSHWGEQRGKHLFALMNRPVEKGAETITCFRDGEVTLRRNRRTTGFTESLTEVGYQGIKKGDLVIHQMDAFAGAVGVSDSDGKSTPVYSVCQPKQELSVHYYAYLIREMARSQFILSLSRGIRQRSCDFRFSAFGQCTLLVPPLAEQQKIVDYLDAKCSEIDALTERRERIIEHLQELKQSIIAHAVTRGLDPDTPTKDSGVSWLGQVPVHWEHVPAMRLFKEVKLKNSDGVLTQELQFRYGTIIPKPAKEYDETALNIVKGYTVVEPDDIILNGLNLNYDFVSQRAARVETKGVITSAYLSLRADMTQIMPTFAVFYLKGLDSQKIFHGIGKGIRKVMNYSSIKRLPVVLPNLKEQASIVSFLEKKCALIDKQVARHRSMIERLKELKTSLIAAAVTGKIDVR